MDPFPLDRTLTVGALWLAVAAAAARLYSPSWSRGRRALAVGAVIASTRLLECAADGAHYPNLGAAVSSGLLESVLALAVTVPLAYGAVRLREKGNAGAGLSWVLLLVALFGINIAFVKM